MTDDIRWCPVCGGWVEAGYSSSCTCYEDEDADRGDWEYHVWKDKQLDDMEG